MGTVDEGQERIRAQVEWWALVLGLVDWRFEVKYGHADEGRHAARTWIHDDYHNATIEVVGEENTPPDWPWKYWPEEENVVHELLHVVTVDMRNIVNELIIPELPKALRKSMRTLFAHEEERMVESLARALVAVSGTHRDHLPPSVGLVLDGQEA
jgi:hypothetical protein